MTRKSALAIVAICICVVQAIASQLLRRDPYLPSPPRLVTLPMALGPWSQVADEGVAPEALDMLGPDDYLARLYAKSGQPGDAEVFVAYYKTQLRAKNAHDPKVCLPGAGWNPVSTHLTSVSRGNAASFPVNYYRIKKEDNEQVVLYWFQTLRGVYAGEQQLKAHRVWDAIVDNRTDMALVRIIVPVTASGVTDADASASDLAKILYTQMLSYFPPTQKAAS